MATKKTTKKKAAAARPCELSEAVYALLNSDNKLKALQSKKITPPETSGALTAAQHAEFVKAQKAFEEKMLYNGADISTEKRLLNQLRENLIAIVPAPNKWFLTENGKHAVAVSITLGDFGQTFTQLLVETNVKPEHLNTID